MNDVMGLAERRGLQVSMAKKNGVIHVKEVFCATTFIDRDWLKPYNISSKLLSFYVYVLCAKEHRGGASSIVTSGQY